VFDDTTIRQTVKLSLDTDVIRLEINNVFGGSDLSITAATVAIPANQTVGIKAIQTDTTQALTFSGSQSFIVPNGASVLSDPIHMPVAAQSILSISIYLKNGQTTNEITSHPGSRTTSFFAKGNHLESLDFEAETAGSADHWYFISAVEGLIPGTASTVAIVGDSITDGRGSTTNGNDRWPDQLLVRLSENPTTRSTAILNQAAGGNRILNDGLGPNALGRIDRDVTSHPGVRHAIIFEGVNDIGTAGTDEATQSVVGDRVIQAYDQIVQRLHRHKITVIGATITPMTGTGQVYGHPNREATRQRVNKWIRESGVFDAVIDFDEVVRDPAQQDQLLPKYDTGDHLHLNPAGYLAMAESVDLKLFETGR
jgi:lysophospholipase L1-like esterase